MDKKAERHPLLDSGLPEWLAAVPIEVSKATPVEVGGGKTIAASLLIDALQKEVGVTLGSMSIAPELAARIAEMTENPDWRNLPSEPTWIERQDVDRWEVRVGEVRVTLDRSAIEEKLVTAFRDSLEEQD